MKTTNYSVVKEDLMGKLSLNKLRSLIEPFKNQKILIAITARAEFKDYLTKDIPMTQMEKNNPYYNSPSSYCGINFYVIKSQVEAVKYWYNDQSKELHTYLKNNV